MLIYEGDPLLYHSKSMVKVVEKQEIELDDLIVYERMANSNNKTLLIAYQDATGEISFCEISYLNKINT